MYFYCTDKHGLYVLIDGKKNHMQIVHFVDCSIFILCQMARVSPQVPFLPILIILILIQKFTTLCFNIHVRFGHFQFVTDCTCTSIIVVYE